MRLPNLPLVQPAVYKLLRAAWGGGGFNELFYNQQERKRFLLWSLFGGVYILAYNAVGTLVLALWPPLADAYTTAIRCGPDGTAGSP